MKHGDQIGEDLKNKNHAIDIRSNSAHFHETIMETYSAIVGKSRNSPSTLGKLYLKQIQTYDKTMKLREKINEEQNRKFLEEAQVWALADIERMEAEVRPLIEVATKQAEETYKLLEKSGALRAVETANEFLEVVEGFKDSIPESFYTSPKQSFAPLGSQTLVEPVEAVTQTRMAIEVENGEFKFKSRFSFIDYEVW